VEPPHGLPEEREMEADETKDEERVAEESEDEEEVAAEGEQRAKRGQAEKPKE
jgi:hypothetical protein